MTLEGRMQTARSLAAQLRDALSPLDGKIRMKEARRLATALHESLKEIRIPHTRKRPAVKRRQWRGVDGEGVSHATSPQLRRNSKRTAKHDRIAQKLIDKAIKEAEK